MSAAAALAPLPARGLSPEMEARRSALAQALALLAVDPSGLGGMDLSGPASADVNLLLERFRRTLPGAPAMRRLPPSIGDDRLIGGIDLSATLSAGRPVLRNGLLSEIDGGLLIAPMAERLDRTVAARLAAALDSGDVRIERDGFSRTLAARFALIALDEAEPGEAGLSAPLRDRLAFAMPVDGLGRISGTDIDLPSTTEITTARSLLPTIAMGNGMIEALCAAAAAFGISSLRAPLLAARAARASAALDGRSTIEAADIEVAAALVLAPRATQLPAPPDQSEPETSEPPPPQDQSEGEQQKPAEDKPLDDLIIAAIRAALPEQLLAGLIAEARSSAKTSGGAGTLAKSAQRGRPVGSRRGELRNGQRLALLDTMRSAAPWQPLRRREWMAGKPDIAAPPILVRKQDIRIRRFKQQAETATIFCVDASGSSALNRLAEAKGAIELLLADCYVRRDSVALIAFRGEKAEMLLPPTRALARARRSLSGLPGGGGTPLAAAIDEAAKAAIECKRRGQTAILVFLTDGKANICRNGEADRARAHAEALAAGKAFSLLGGAVLFIDTSPRPQQQGREIAAAMRARYLPLPRADAASVSEAVKSVAAAATGA